MTNPWQGTFSAMITPFADDGGIDLAATAAHVDRLVAAGIEGLVVGGSTGEFYSQSAEERIGFLADVKAIADGRLTLVAGTSALEMRQTLALTRAAKDAGYDGCMVLPPMYCLPPANEVVAYFEAVAAIGLPVMVYNNPARVGIGLSAATAAAICRLPGVAAYKESARDLYAIAEIYYATRDDVAHFAGLEPYASALFSRGGAGIVSTISNLCPREVVNYARAIRAGDAAAVSANQQVIDQLYHLLAASGLANFAFVKTAMRAIGRPGGVVRPPHAMGDAAGDAALEAKIAAIYAGAGIDLPN